MTDGVPRPRLDWTSKAAPLGEVVDRDTLAGLDWRLTDQRTSTPVAVLRQSALAHNIALMRDYCRPYGVDLAPHVKTTMSPQLWQLQQEAGAWAATVATPHQAEVVLTFGAQRVIVASEVVSDAALRWFGEQMQARDDVDILWYVDSEAGVEAAERSLHAVGLRRTASVLIELGHAGGRTGLRSIDEAIGLARSVQASDSLRLAGVSAFEGTVAGGRAPADLERVDEFLLELAACFRRLAREGLLDARSEPIVSAGGSMFFDRVTHVLAPLRSEGARVLLRSGCYVAHDSGLYQSESPDTDPGWTLPRFRPSLEVWGTVLSRPEQALAVLDVGRRDVSYDQGLPAPVRRAARGSAPTHFEDGTVAALNDQHAYLRVPHDSPLRIGDLVGLGVSHPCTTFDRWSTLLVVDDDDRIVDLVSTYF